MIRLRWSGAGYFKRRSTLSAFIRQARLVAASSPLTHYVIVCRPAATLFWLEVAWRHISSVAIGIGV
ncbi:hypothetical protein GW17_00039651 [Ensete ventricosum]|nr:hypothetical protein GW17_00039651 [Ensete ventricosum]RZR94634.1 hypothetical protein BHM03_00023361 [Ensete ventricosum]